MNISVKIINHNEYLVKLFGEIDESCANEFRTVLDDIIDKNFNINIVLDFSKLDFMDSTAIGVILGRYKKCIKKNIFLFIKNPSTHIDFILKTCGIYSIIKKVA